MQVVERRNLENEIFFLTDTLIEKTIELGNKEFTEDNEEYINCVMVMDELIGKLATYLSGREEYLEDLLRQIISQKLPDQRVLASFQSFSNNLECIIVTGLERFQQSKILEHIEALPEEETELIAETRANEASNDVAENTVNKSPIEEKANESQQSMADSYLENQETEKEDRQGQDNMAESMVVNLNNEAAETDLNDSPSEIENRYEEEDKVIILEKILSQFFKGKKILKNYKLYGMDFQYFLPELNLAIELSNTARQPKKEVWKEYYCSKANITTIAISPEELNYYRRVVKHLRRFCVPHD